MSNSTVLICAECGEGNYRANTMPALVHCTVCRRVLHRSDFELDAGESLTFTATGELAVVHGEEQ